MAVENGATMDNTPEQRQRIQIKLRESGMTQPLIAAAMGVSLSTVNRAHIAYDRGGVKAHKPGSSGGRKPENMTLKEEKALLARFAKAAGAGEMLNISRSQSGLRKGHRARNQPEHDL